MARSIVRYCYECGKKIRGWRYQALRDSKWVYLCQECRKKPKDKEEE